MLVHHERPVDQYVGHAFRRTLRVLKGGSIAHVLGIERDHVGGGAWTQGPAIEEAESRGWLTRQLAHHLLEPHQPELAHIHAEIPGEGAPGARMRTVTDHDSVASRHVRRMLEDGPHVFLVAGEDQRAHAERVDQQQVAIEFEWSAPAPSGCGSVSDALANVVAVLRMAHASDDDPFPIHGDAVKT